MEKHFTSESVCAGHPDKICDQISDAILDAALTVDPYARVAVETLVTTNQIVLAGEVTCREKIAYEIIARKAVARLGYTNPAFHFSDKSAVTCLIHSQSPDISAGVDTGGAGDQGMMYGYATDETPELMPLPITLSHRLAERLDAVKTNELPYLRPDGKTEVVVRYKKNIPVAVESVVIAVPHDANIDPEQIKKDVSSAVIHPVLEQYGFSIPNGENICINGTGKWEIGGPASDTGVTGRKIIVDTYGSFARHGGGAFSGKDPTKVDRTGAYACRYIAKNIVAAKLAKQCEVRVAYVIGKPEPLTWDIECFQTETKPMGSLYEFAKKLSDLRVTAIIDTLKLRNPIYERTAAYGHFGRDGFPWEAVV